MLVIIYIQSIVEVVYFYYRVQKIGAFVDYSVSGITCFVHKLFPVNKKFDLCLCFYEVMEKDNSNVTQPMHRVIDHDVLI